MQIKRIEISKLKPATYNPRQISKSQFDSLRESIDKFGLVDPIIVNKDMTIIGGHQRYKIWEEKAKQSSIDDITIPCVVLELNKEQERELNIRLNKSGGEWDFDLLSNFEIEELKDWGFKDVEFGFNIDKIVEGNTEDDHIPEVKESRVKLGDVWKLGKHRLMCGDSTKESDVAKLMNGQKADMVFTDPPYGMNLQTDFKDIYNKSNHLKNRNKNNYEKVIGDNKEFDFLKIYNFVKDIKEQFWWCADYYCNNLPKKGGWFVWNKKTTDNLVKSIGNQFELCFSKTAHKRKIYNYTWSGALGMKKEDGKRKHPTQKPIGLCEIFIKEFSKSTNIIIDLFLGSGSTLIACEKQTEYVMEWN